MIKCRICFKSNKDLKMLPLNGQYVSYFNLLTNLKVRLIDVTRQRLCENCIEMLNLFVEFRNKCILANSILQSNYMIEKDIKQEDEKENCSYIIQNIKIEMGEHHEIASDDGYLQLFTDNDNQFVDDLDNDVKWVADNMVKDITEKQKMKNISTIDFPCGLCPKSFDDRSSMSNHLETHKKDEICLLCTDKFTEWEQLFSHRLEHVSCKDKICHICFKRFRASSYLEYHYKNIHSVDKKILLRCLQCNKASKTPRLLQKHIWRCHSDKKFICDFCSKEFKTKQQMKIHIVIHMEYKPFVCDLCDFSCKFYSSLRGHKLSKHTPERVYCRMCNRVFGNQLIRDEHKCLYKLSVCSKCGKTFYGTGPTYLWKTVEQKSGSAW